MGSTGAGKTTITNLINRFYDVQGGRVLYDGIDVRDIKKDALRRSLGIVLQDTHLFTGTIADNIRFGKLDATQEEVERAARIANADSFIRRLPQGYDTMVTADGANLSQGQRQLLAIARAAVADPPVLILDEATSSIDTRTEALIEKGMDQLMEGRTVFVIAHRLSTVRNADAILVLEHGQVVERGEPRGPAGPEGRVLPALQRHVRAELTAEKHPGPGTQFRGRDSVSKKSFRHAAELFETSKSFKKLFDPTRKGTLTVHLRAKCRPRGGCAPKRPAGQPFTLSFPPNPSAGGFIDSLPGPGT